MARYTKTHTVSTVPEINSELEKIAAAQQELLSRKGESPNQMEDILDMNSQKVINVGAPTDPTDAVRLQDLETVEQTIIAEIGIPSIAHISTFETPAQDAITAGTSTYSTLHAEMLHQGFLGAEKLVFGSYDITLEETFNIPAGARVLELDFQGSSLNLPENAQFKGSIQSLTFKNATIDGGLKRATLTSAFVPDGLNRTFNVADSSAFEIGDLITTSFDNRYMPNSSSRINNPPTYPLTDFARVLNKTSTSITVNLAGVGNGAIPSGRDTIPQNAELLNTRFDLVTMALTGSGEFIFENVHFQNTANAYCVQIDDSAEKADVLFQNCSVKNCALDSFRFRVNSCTFNQFELDTLVDIGKQFIVWANQTKHGKLSISDSNIVVNNTDAFLFAFPAAGTTAYAPSMSFENSIFDGRNNKSFLPMTKYGGNTLNFMGYFPSLQDTADAGNVHAKNCQFLGFTRHIMGSTYAPTDTYKQDHVLYENCFLDADGIYVQSSTSEMQSVKYINSTVHGTTFRLGEGCKNVIYDSTRVVENFPEDSSKYETVDTAITSVTPISTYYLDSSTGRKYRQDAITVQVGDLLSDTSKFSYIGLDGTDINRGAFVNGSALIGRFKVKAADVLFDDCFLERRENDTTPAFEAIESDGIDNSFILRGVPSADRTELNLQDWFVVLGSEQDVPSFTFRVENTDAVILYGGVSGFSSEYRFRLSNRQQDPLVGETCPFQQKGAFLVKPVLGTEIHGTRDRGTRVVDNVQACDIVGTAGSPAITISNIAGGATAYAGDWVAVNPEGTNQVYYYELNANLEVRGGFDVDIVSTDPAYLVKHRRTDTELARMDFFTNDDFNYFNSTTDFTDITLENKSYQRSQRLIPYIQGASTSVNEALAVPTGRFVLPRGRYYASVSACVRHDNAATAVNSLEASVRIYCASSPTGVFQQIKSPMCLVSRDNATQGSLSVTPYVEGYFELDEEETVAFQVYCNRPARLYGSGLGNAARVTITKIGE